MLLTTVWIWDVVVASDAHAITLEMIARTPNRNRRRTRLMQSPSLTTIRLTEATTPHPYLAVPFERVRADTSIGGTHVQMTWRALLRNAKCWRALVPTTRWKETFNAMSRVAPVSQSCERDHNALDPRRCRLAG